MKKAKSSVKQGKRGLWKGHISFGLVSIPVQVMSAKEQKELHFSMIDPRDFSPVGYKYYNKHSGKDVKHNETVKGYEYKKGSFVVLNEADFKKANPIATQTIDIENFVHLDDIDPVFFDRAYYLLPLKGGEKAYGLLTEALHKSRKVAIAKIVMHTKQHLVALIPRGKFLLLELLHFAEDVKELSEIEDWKQDIRISKNPTQEVAMAERLIEDMTSTWDPNLYKDTYREDVMKRIKAKIKSGKAKEITPIEEVSEPEYAGAQVLDLMPLLKKSLAAKKTRNGKHKEKRVHH
jgi:DNA end-binding protein Ku